jgi:3'-5' exonuclease
MPKVIFDIETVGCDFDTLDETSQEYFLKYAKTDTERAEIRDSMSFYPLTAQIVAIGMLEEETDKGWVFFQSKDEKIKKFTEGKIEYVSGDEREILENFWAQMKKFTTFITFNGRVFDCPFIMLRSAILKIKPSKNIMPYRYGHAVHVDLQDQLTFYYAMNKRFSLHLWCKAFGVKSPKEGGITGLQVKDFFKQGKYAEIARYCARDLYATKELYGYWEKFLKY